MGTLIYFLIFGAAFYFMMRFGYGAHVLGQLRFMVHLPTISAQPNVAINLSRALNLIAPQRLAI